MGPKCEKKPFFPNAFHEKKHYNHEIIELQRKGFTT